MRREYVAAAVQERAGTIAFSNGRDVPVFGTARIVEGRATRKVGVGTVTKRCIACMFTATEEQFLVLRSGGKRDGTEVAPLVGAVAEGLFRRAAAGAPEIGSPGLDAHQAWFRARNNWGRAHRRVLSRTTPRLYRPALGWPA